MKTMYRHLLMRDEAGAVHRPIQDLAGARPWREGARQQHHPTSPHVASWRFDDKKNISEVCEVMASTAAAALRRCACPGALLATFQRGAPGRAQRALYGGRQIGVGNSVSFSERKYAHPEHGHTLGPQPAIAPAPAPDARGLPV